MFALADDTTLLTRYTERKHNAIWSQAALDSGAWQALHDAIRAEAETALRSDSSKARASCR